jgi:hypothetical protein
MIPQNWQRFLQRHRRAVGADRLLDLERNRAALAAAGDRIYIGIPERPRGGAPFGLLFTPSERGLTAAKVPKAQRYSVPRRSLAGLGAIPTITALMGELRALQAALAAPATWNDMAAKIETWTDAPFKDTPGVRRLDRDEIYSRAMDLAMENWLETVLTSRALWERARVTLYAPIPEAKAHEQEWDVGETSSLRDAFDAAHAELERILLRVVRDATDRDAAVAEALADAFEDVELSIRPSVLRVWKFVLDPVPVVSSRGSVLRYRVVLNVEEDPNIGWRGAATYKQPVEYGLVDTGSGGAFVPLTRTRDLPLLPAENVVRLLLTAVVDMGKSFMRAEGDFTLAKDWQAPEDVYDIRDDENAFPLELAWDAVADYLNTHLRTPLDTLEYNVDEVLRRLFGPLNEVFAEAGVPNRGSVIERLLARWRATFTKPPTRE